MRIIKLLNYIFLPLIFFLIFATSCNNSIEGEYDEYKDNVKEEKVLINLVSDDSNEYLISCSDGWTAKGYYFKNAETLKTHWKSYGRNGFHTAIYNQEEKCFYVDIFNEDFENLGSLIWKKVD